MSFRLFGMRRLPPLETLPPLHEVDGEASGGSDSFIDDDDNVVDDSEDSEDSYSRSSKSLGMTGSVTGTNSGNGGTTQLSAIQESTRICWYRGTVICAFTVAAVVLSIVVYHLSSKSENERFEIQFHNHADKTVDAMLVKLEHAIVAVDNLGATISSSLSSSSQTAPRDWPFVVLQDFESRVARTRQLSNAALLAFAPLVTEHQRSDWESFAVNNTEWITEGLQAQPTTLDISSQPWGVRSRSLAEQEKNDTVDMEQSLQDFFNEFEGKGAVDPSRLVNTTNDIPNVIFHIEKFNRVVETERPLYSPLWQGSPVIPNITNFNLLSHQDFGTELQLAIDTQQIVIGAMADIGDHEDILRSAVSQPRCKGSNIIKCYDEPVSGIFFPVFDSTGQVVIGSLTSIVYWSDYLVATTDSKLDPETDMVFVLRNDNNNSHCEHEQAESHSFSISFDDGVSYMGKGDLHDPELDYLEVSIDLGTIDPDSWNKALFSRATVGIEDNCPLTLHIYPTVAMQDDFITNRPTILTAIVVVVFTVAALSFLIYDTLVDQRQKFVMDKAIKSERIVTQLFPAVVRDRLFGNDEEEEEEDKVTNNISPSQPLQPLVTEKVRLKNFLHTGGLHKDGGHQESKPIADLFKNCTVLFADIAGFTAWSSVREPAQVFTLLENIYSSFDKIAVRRKVFKVETIGDCYMAVTGLPDPQQDHAIIMARFARDCLLKISKLTRRLEVELGPGTGELDMRFGLNSGPVTAGVLRGQKSRFQLFGDTVNTASRMETTGRSNHIQCSQATADLLTAGGKGHWLLAREDKVEAKGKGEVQTYWIMPKALTVSTSQNGSRMSFSNNTTTSTSGSDSASELSGSYHGNQMVLDDSLSGESPRRLRRPTKLSAHQQRLVGWTSDLLANLLKCVIVSRRNSQVGQKNKIIIPNTITHFGNMTSASSPTNPRDDYKEKISLPKFKDAMAKSRVDPGTIMLDPVVEEQLRDYVRTVASSYHSGNCFHNFEHATHVLMSANKILKRVVAADDCDVQKDTVDTVFSHLHDYTHGITSDPLTHFAIVFAALIHDVDHPGVSNMQLVKEKDERAILYKNKSVAEQNSVDVAWELLMDSDYEDLRACIFTNEAEYDRFRSLLVNSVMATDIFDPDLMAMRNKRWEMAFAGGPNHNKQDSKDDDNKTSNTYGNDQKNNIDTDDNGDITDLKATIVIEHIIQASDVAHTMQHWHVYQKWNQKLFDEVYRAFKDGRVEKDPSEGWYKGELWFYDNYIIPLAKKLQECAVFGAASDEFLIYAMDNRTEWEQKGENIVNDMKRRAEERAKSLETQLEWARRQATRPKVHHDTTDDDSSLNSDEENQKQSNEGETK